MANVPTSQLPPCKPTWRRWLQFSLGSLLMLMFLAAVALQLWLNRVEPQRHTVRPLAWDVETGENILWRAKLGSQTYATPRIAGGKVFIGTNNGAGWIARYPREHDLGVLLCFDAATGDFLWQHSNEKLPQGRVVDWQLQGIPSTPYVEGDRLWYVTNRCEVVCLDTEGFYDGEDDGPLQREQRSAEQKWVKLFSMPTTLVGTMPTWDMEIHPTLREAFAKVEADRRGAKSKGNVITYFTASRGKAAGSWKLKRHEYGSQSGATLFYEIRLVGDKLEVYAGQHKAGKRLFSVPNELFPDMGSATLARELRWHLEDVRGISLPAQLDIRETTFGSIWSFSAKYGRVVSDFQIRRNGAYLGVYKLASTEDKQDADVIWKFSMMGKLGVVPHNMTHCSIVCAGDLLFINTCNGVDLSHVNVPSPKAPNFLAMNKHTGKVVWTDNSVGTSVLHSGWASPTYAVLGGVPQVLFPGGDGWLYSFAAEGDANGNSKLLWKFDTNQKRTKWLLGGRGTRNSLIASAVVHDGLVYLVNGQDPEHGEGNGHLWCIDPTRRGDVSPELVFSADDPTTPIPPRTRTQAAGPGDFVRPNPNSAAVWHYDKVDLNGDGTLDFEEEFHRSLSRPAFGGGLLIISDFTGLVHCLNAKTGKPYWTYDLLAACWSSPVIIRNYVYVGDEDGDVTVFGLSPDPKIAVPGSVPGGDPTEGAVGGVLMPHSIYATPVMHRGVLYVPTKSHLYAIRRGANYKKGKK